MLDLGSVDDVFEDLVQGVACVQAPIRVWRAILETKLLVFGSLVPLPFVEVVGTALDVPVDKSEIWPYTGGDKIRETRRGGRWSRNAHGKSVFGSFTVEAQTLFNMVSYSALWADCRIMCGCPAQFAT